ncbi:hypothetical protein BU17DRAFT_40485 [Hysterangium stoloniferum]|nr:hypothetical protein BU17DRAFT_40485 [Hysterangium stoloniferum]
MAPAEFFIRLQHGITGGFVPPSPSAIHTITRSEDSPAELVVQSARKADGMGSLSEAMPDLKRIAVDPHEALIDELESILKALPVESPRGSEDIYGFDICILYGSKSLQWNNAGPSGCGGGTSETRATEEDKKKFKRAIDIIDELVSKEA